MPWIDQYCCLPTNTTLQRNNSVDNMIQKSAAYNEYGRDESESDSSSNESNSEGDNSTAIRKSAAYNEYGRDESESDSSNLQTSFYSFHRFIISEKGTIGLNFTLETKTNKVRVSTVLANSIALKHGVQVDDEILAPSSYNASDTNVYKLFLAGAKSRPLLFEVKRANSVSSLVKLGSVNKVLHRFVITNQGSLGMTCVKQALVPGKEATSTQISKVALNSLSEIHGLQINDIICRPGSNGTELVDFKSFIALAKSGVRPLTIEVLRDVGGSRKSTIRSANANPYVISFPTLPQNKEERSLSESEADTEDNKVFKPLPATFKYGRTSSKEKKKKTKEKLKKKKKKRKKKDEMPLLEPRDYCSDSDSDSDSNVGISRSRMPMSQFRRRSESSDVSDSEETWPRMSAQKDSSGHQPQTLPFLIDKEHEDDPKDLDAEEDLDAEDTSVVDDDIQLNSDDDKSIPTVSQILAFGLASVGFGEKRQRVRAQLNDRRFKAHYGVGPKTVQASYKDVKKRYESTELRYYMLTLNWFKLYGTEPVLAGVWGKCEAHISKKLMDYAKRIQSMKDKKITFEGWGDNEIHIITVDGVNFKTHEFRLDPSSKWYDHKSASSGLTYEFALAIRHQKLVWIKGPLPAGAQHDITIFRGGRTKHGKSTWDRNSLYFKLPEGKKAVGDSGYGGEPKKVVVSKPQHSPEFRKFLARAKNRQESFHTRLKSFNILGSRFRHGKKGTKHKMELHKTCVEAVCVLVQYDMENGAPLFEVD